MLLPEVRLRKLDRFFIDIGIFISSTRNLNNIKSHVTVHITWIDLSLSLDID